MYFIRSSMITFQLIILLIAFCAITVASPGHGNSVHRARHPTPSKRYASPVEPRAPSPSKRHIARAPSPSKRHFSPFEARVHVPSKQLSGDRAPAPVPSKRYAPSFPINVVKRGIDEQETLEAPNTIFPEEELCPTSKSACPVSGSLDDYECFDFHVDLTSCGGCASNDISHDCSAIPGILSVSCINGSCRVHSCKDGFHLSADNETCIPN